jgi:TPR repeat protein
MTYFDRLQNGLLAIVGPPTTKLAVARNLAAKGAHQAAFPLFVKAAKRGLPKAWYELGRAYLLGHGVPPSLTEALRWLTRAAEADESDAQSLLAGVALQGVRAVGKGLFDTISMDEDSSANYDCALKWAARAAAGGSLEAKSLLAFILTAGPDQIRDEKRGAVLFKEAAEAGDAQGQLGWALVLLRRSTPASLVDARVFLEAAASADLPTAHYVLGIIHESGITGTPDFPMAAAHYRAAAERGHHQAELRYGIVLLVGRGVERDVFNAESWLRRSGLAGEPQAAAMVGDLYARASPLPANCFEAAIWFRRAAESGHVGAARALAQLLSHGDGLVHDLPEAARWLRVAAAQGDDGAMDELGRLALTGELPEADCRAVLAWFQQKADAGDLAASFNLGVCLAEGIGTLPNEARALALFREAATRLPCAQYWCGRMLADGRGALSDPQAARTWFLRAAEQGYADAKVAAGEMLFNGRGGPPDRTVAMALFTRAAATGHRGAIRALEILGHLSPGGRFGGLSTSGQIASA